MDLSTNSKAKLMLIRHADRYMITDIKSHESVLLTEKGKKDAYVFGKKLKSRYDKFVLFHSPVERCAQTAEYIYKGINDTRNSKLIGEKEVIGGGYMSVDSKLFAAYFNSYGYKKFLRKWLDNDLPEDVMKTCGQVARVQIQLFNQQLDSYDKFIVNITHDWNIIVILEYYFHLKFEDIGIPGYLDGITAYKQNNTIHLQYNKYHSKVVV